MPQFDSKALEALVAANLRESPPGISAPAPPKKGISKWAQLATLGGHTADAMSTIHALKHPDVQELNPVYGNKPSTGKVLGVKGGSAAVQLLMQHLIGKKSPKLANFLGYGTGATLGGVAIHNLTQARKSNK